MIPAKIEDVLLHNRTNIYKYVDQLYQKRNDIFFIRREIVAQNLELERLRKIADKANEEKSCFFAMISHEIKNSLNCILGYSTIISSEKLNDNLTEHVKNLSSAGTKLKTIVTNILDLSCLEAGKLALATELLSLKEVMKNCEKEMEQLELNEGVKVVYILPENLPEFILGDAVRIQQILANLISNAIKFTKKGSIKISLKIISQTVNDVKIVFEVVDTGIGMSKEQHLGIFEQTDLHVGATGTFYVAPTAHVYVTNDLNVVANGNLTVSSGSADSGSLIVKGAATGDISYERYITTANAHLISAPAGLESINAFAGANSVGVASTNYQIARYDNSKASGSRWESFTVSPDVTTIGNFANGKGYLARRSSDGFFTFNGAMKPTGATIEIPQNAIQATGHNWTLVGNPYPSFLSANSGASGGTTSLLNVNLSKLHTPFAYIRVLINNAFVALNFATPAHYLAPGQGFFVDPAFGTPSDFVFPENLQVPQPATGTSTFYRTVAPPTLTINLSNGSQTTNTVLKYFSNTTPGLDVGWDAGAFDTEADFSIHTHLIEEGNGIDFILQCLPDSNYEASVVPLSVKATANEVITFSTALDNFPADLKVFLEDKEAKTITEITSDSHQVTLDANVSGIGRFYLYTSGSALGINDPNALSVLNIYKTTNRNLRITGLPESSGKASVKMYSITGKQVLSNSFVMENVKDIVLPDLSAGVYIVQLVANGDEQTKKLIIE